MTVRYQKGDGLMLNFATPPVHEDRFVATRTRVSDPFVADVIATVAAEFALSEREMMAPSRDHRLWKPRIAAMYYARLLTQCSLPELGRVFGGRSHTTVLRAFRRCREMIDSDPNWAGRMDRLLVKLVEKIVAPRL